MSATTKTIPEQLADAQARIKDLEGQLSDANGKVTTAEKALADARTTHATEKTALEKQVTDAKAEVTARDVEITKLKGEAKSASERAAELAAGVGVTSVRTDGGKSDPANAEETLDQVRTKLAATKDPSERGRLAAKAAKLRAEA